MDRGAWRATESDTCERLSTHAHAYVIVAVVAARRADLPKMGSPGVPVAGISLSQSSFLCVALSWVVFGESEVLAKARTVGLGVQ